MNLIVSLFAGLVFGLGLIVSGMANPAKVLAFLDLAGPRWDPSLMLVLGAAVGVYALGSPRFTADLPPPRRELNLPLILGAALFGVGWGLAGYCPGPALASLAQGGAKPLLFFIAMLVGMALFELLERAKAKAASPAA